MARQRQQLPRLHGGDLRHHGLQRERVAAPARRLLQQGAEPVERAERTQVRGGFRYKGISDGFRGESIRFQAVGLALNSPSLAYSEAVRKQDLAKNEIY